jgi:hypothetical protein
MTGNYKGLDYEFRQQADSTWSATIEGDLLRLFDYRDRETLIKVVKSSIASLDRHDLRKHGDEEEPGKE